MPEPRQRPIPVTSQERAKLEEAKRQYEEATGDVGDWGRFLLTVIAVGLGGLGIYLLTRARERSSRSINVQCPACDSLFAVAFEGEPPSVAQVMCPACQTELVVDCRGGEAPNI